MEAFTLGDFALYACHLVQVVEISHEEARGVYCYKVVGVEYPLAPPLGYAWVGYHQLTPLCFYPNAYYWDDHLS